MCLDIIKSPVSAIAKAKQKRDINRTIIRMLEIAAIFGIAASIITARTASYNIMFLLSSFLSSFSMFILFTAVLGWVVKIAAVNLGGRGDFYEGFTAITYALAPFAAGLLAISLLLYLPVIGSIIAFFVVLPALAAALSILYRAIKELYRTDMLVAFVTVSITITVFVLAIVFLSGSLMPMML